MYVVMNFGVFVCSQCAGIHREINHKVKGISMSNFSDAELQNLTENGNLVSESNTLPECDLTVRVSYRTNRHH